MAEESSSQQQQSPKDTSDLEEGGATTEDANGNAPPPEKHVAPHRGIHRSIGTHALPCLVVHVFHIDKEAKVEPFEDHHAGLLEALSAEKNDIDTPVGIPTDSNKEGKHREKNGGKDKDISLQRSYWVDIDADERDRPEVNEWIQKLNFGSLITDTITKPAEGTCDGIDFHCGSRSIRSFLSPRLMSMLVLMLRSSHRVGITCCQHTVQSFDYDSDCSTGEG